MGPVLLGEAAQRTEGLWQEMYQEGLLHGRTGSVMRALSALDVARWDRHAPLDVARHLIAEHRRGVALEVTAAARVGRHRAQGFCAVKMKIGRLSPKEEARVAAARETIGPDVLLMLDANNGWADPPASR